MYIHTFCRVLCSTYVLVTVFDVLLWEGEKSKWEYSAFLPHVYREQGAVTLVEASRYGDIKHTQLFLKLQKVVLHKRRNVPGNSHLIIHGNKSHQQDKRRKESSAFEQQKSQKMCLLRWLRLKTFFPSKIDQSFSFFPVITETKKPLASGLNRVQGCWALSDLPTVLVSAWEERCHLSSLALERQEDIPQSCCEDRKVVFGSSLGIMFTYMHAQVQSTSPILSMCHTNKCKSRAKEWCILLSAFSFRGLQGVWCLGCWKCLRFLRYSLVVCDKCCWIAVIATVANKNLCLWMVMLYNFKLLQSTGEGFVACVVWRKGDL